MIKTSGVYHTSIPADDLKRATRFYVDVLGMTLEKEIGGEDGGLLARLRCGEDAVVLFQRPQAINRDSQAENGIYHQAFHVSLEDFEGAMAALKEQGYYRHGPIDRPSGRTVYFVDTEGNYQELHAP